MPTPRKYTCAAERQAAYRRRLAQSQAQSKMNQIPVVPGHRRWRAMRNQCISILNEARGEMQAYSDQRSEQWRDSERGEALVEMMESMAEVAEALQEIDIK